MNAPVLPASDAGAIAEAVAALRAGALVAMPTETVYGLAADATNARAVARIYEAKGRPRFNPLIVHVGSLAAARGIAAFTPDAEKLAAAFWPGPLTLVLPLTASSPVADLVTAGLPSVAVRMPSHTAARALLAAFGRPLAAPSANRSGHVSATTAAHVAADLGSRVAVILDGGPALLGVESTIVSLADTQPTLLRPGAIAREKIEAMLRRRLADAADAGEKPQAPGMLRSHYAPSARIRLDATDVRPGEALLAFGPLPASAANAVTLFNLSESGDLVEAAANLFAALRSLDGKAETIAVMPIPETGLGEAINDRLNRAAAPRG